MRPASPLNATYEIDGERISLTDGRAVTVVFPGAASQSETRIFGAPVTGDLDGDGDGDAALLITRTHGGSGTFYYAAAALTEGSVVTGTNAILLGDRIVPQTLALRHGVVIVDYADRNSDEPMAAPPTADQSKYLVLDDNRLQEIPLADGEMILAGEVIIGHEVRSIKTCGEPVESWLLGSSPALAAILAAYHENLPKSPPYTPMLMVLTGSFSNPPVDGFGADYTSAILAERLIKTLPGKPCNE